MKSMTGFGRGEFKDEKFECIVELKTINHRYRDYFIRMPKQLNCIEDRIRNIINSYVIRGRIEIYVDLEVLDLNEREVKLDLGLAKGYYSALNKLKQYLPELNGDINLSFLARFPEVLKVKENEYDIEELWEILSRALIEAINNLEQARIEEGEKLKIDLISHCNKIEEGIKNIKNICPQVEKEYEDRLVEKIAEFTSSVELDKTRILTEVAILADKVSIDEELIRLKSHIIQFNNTLNEKVMGRKLDFIVQEMNREINTIGSKGNNYAISSQVVLIKSELEKIREQIQNIE